MKTLAETTYICEECGRRSHNKERVIKCEQRHPLLDKILKCTEFTITENHLKLIKRQNVKFNYWTEYGATEIDPKRPYGNGYVESDIGEILGLEPDELEPDGSRSYSEELKAELYLLHVETTIALQICVQLLTFEIGNYRRKNWYGGGKWEKDERVLAEVEEN